jgi:hypothetical protein
VVGPAVEPEWFGTVPAFVGGLLLLKDRSLVGAGEQRRRAVVLGCALPRLVPWELPSAEGVAALTRVCGYGEDMVARWVAVRYRLAYGPQPVRPPAWRRGIHHVSWRQLDNWSPAMWAVFWAAFAVVTAAGVVAGWLSGR